MIISSIFLSKYEAMITWFEVMMEISMFMKVCETLKYLKNQVSHFSFGERTPPSLHNMENIMLLKVHHVLAIYRIKYFPRRGEAMKSWAYHVLKDEVQNTVLSYYFLKLYYVRMVQFSQHLPKRWQPLIFEKWLCLNIN